MNSTTTMAQCVELCPDGGSSGYRRPYFFVEKLNAKSVLYSESIDNGAGLFLLWQDEPTSWWGLRQSFSRAKARLYKTSLFSRCLFFFLRQRQLPLPSTNFFGALSMPRPLGPLRFHGEPRPIQPRAEIYREPLYTFRDDFRLPFHFL